MCGIAGYCGSGGDGQKLRLATDAIKKRGPDDVGFYEAENIGLGFRRLSIIDLSTGHQPLSNEDGSVWAMLNGEIYNYQELRRLLIDDGHNFKTTGDTEVIVHAYEKWGMDCFKKFEGMFAIALWDSKKLKLLLARDQFGKKPLYWTVQNDTLWFASEIKSLISAKVFEKEIDFDSLSLYFRGDYVPTPKTIFKNVWKLEPATVLSYENGKISKNQFWNFDKEKIKNLDGKSVVKELQKRIDVAVRKRLMSDVPLGLFLSGGLDSSIIAESAGRQSPGLEAFTIGFEDDSYDETEKAEKIAESFGLKHHVEILSEKKALEMISEAVSLLDEPLADPSILPQLLLSEFTKKYVTVALSGDGGDELLLGYQHIPAHIFTEKLKLLPEKILDLISWILKKLPANQNYFSFAFKAERLARGLSIRDRFERDLTWRGAFDKENLKKIFLPQISARLDLDEGSKIMKNYANQAKNLSSWASWSFAYLRTYLMDDVMVKVDRGTMWYGIESRAPLLDPSVVSFLLSLPDEYKLGKWKGKRLFKEILKKKIPDEILSSPKHGFGVPTAKWLRGPLYEKLLEVTEEKFIEKQNIFNRSEIIKMIEDHKNGRSDRRKELWAYLVFQLWYTKWIIN